MGGKARKSGWQKAGTEVRSRIAPGVHIVLPGHLYALISGQAGKDREKKEKTGNGKERTSGRYPAWAEQNPSALTGTSLR